jgi:hypothetical protein
MPICKPLTRRTNIVLYSANHSFFLYRLFGSSSRAGPLVKTSPLMPLTCRLCRLLAGRWLPGSVPAALMFVALLLFQPFLQSAVHAQPAAKLYLPAVYSPPAVLYGTVTYAQKPIAGVEIALLVPIPPDGKPAILETVTTDGAGRYEFKNDPKGMYPLGIRGVYLNVANDARYVNDCSTKALYSVAGGRIPLGDFDIADITLARPADGSTQKLPTTFTWVHNVVPGGSYELSLRATDGGSEQYLSPAITTGKSFTLNALPPGFVYDKDYLWYLRYSRGQAECSSLQSSTVRFAP